MEPTSFAIGFLMYILGIFTGDYCAKNECVQPPVKAEQVQVRTLNK